MSFGADGQAGGGQRCGYRQLVGAKILFMNKHLSGFTLLELMIVLAIVGFASATVVVALRESAHTRLDREAQQLVILLESARAESRITGVPLLWRSSPNGFELSDGVIVRPQNWAHEGIQVSNAWLKLGPDPVIGAQSIRLWRIDAPDVSRWVSSNGLGAFEVRDTDPVLASSGRVP